MMFVMSFGRSESNSDDYDSPSHRMRRQLPESERKACMDICMTDIKQLLQGEVSGYLISERRVCFLLFICLIENVWFLV